MRIRSGLFIAALLLILIGALACRRFGTPTDELAVIDTNYGRIVIEFFPKDAPKNVANFQALARQGFYDGTRFFRLVKKSEEPVAIQGGDPNTISGDPSTWGHGQPGQRTVPAEFSKTLRHVRGTVSMARKENDPDSATSQFFICDTTYPKWDGQYTIFGKVIEGMNVVDTIARAPMFRNTDRPLDPVMVNRVYLVKRGELK